MSDLSSNNIIWRQGTKRRMRHVKGREMEKRTVITNNGKEEGRERSPSPTFLINSLQPIQFENSPLQNLFETDENMIANQTIASGLAIGSENGKSVVTKNASCIPNTDFNNIPSPSNSCVGLLGPDDMDLDMSLEESLDALLSSPKPLASSTLDDINTVNKISGMTVPSLPPTSALGNANTNTNMNKSSKTSLTTIAPRMAQGHPEKGENYMMNAVLMEVQENAKIPNTYNVPIRRQRTPSSSSLAMSALKTQNRSSSIGTGISSGSVSGQPNAVSGQGGTGAGVELMDEIMRLTEEDMTLTEQFLGSGFRESKAAAYSNAGALMSSIGTKVSLMDHETSSFTSDTDEKPIVSTDSSADADAAHNAKLSSSLSVGLTNDSMSIQKSAVARPDMSTNIHPGASGAQTIVPQNRTAVLAVKGSKTKASLHQTRNARPYGRSIPLPIPTKVKSSQLSPKIIANGVTKASASASSTISTLPMSASAVVTAAAAAAAAGNIATLPKSQAHKIASAKPIVVYRNTSARNNIGVLSSTAVRSAPPSSFEITARTSAKPTPSLLEATKKRAQFGFGKNHTVPSVPLPPQSKRLPPSRKVQVHASPLTAPSGVASRTTARSASASSTHQKKLVDTAAAAVTKAPINEGASYERKKQRAKDARVKLNESIERLSIAINLAGTQARERMKTHKGWSSPSNATIKKRQSSEIGLKVDNQSNPKNTSAATIMGEVSKTAKEAKKWDRPSFVGTAASVVQHLNSECEALMRELVQMKKERAQWKDSNLDTCECRKKNSRDEALECTVSVSDSGSFDGGDRTAGGFKGSYIDKRPRKRARIDTDRTTDVFDILRLERIVTIIGGFLDPRSIIQTMSVSQSCQCRLVPLKADIIWSPFCVNRFGAIQVREWQDRYEEDEMLTMDHNRDERNLMLTLYQQMNDANVKPKCHYEGLLHLGGGKIDNVVCAWVSMVERSNGETRRSVLSWNGNDVQYSSLPIVELRILIQNVGISIGDIYIPDQIISVDASTKRRGEEMFEITSDQRFAKKVINLDGSDHIESSSLNGISSSESGIKQLAKLGLFESIVITAYIHVKACPTTSKFKSRAKYVKILVNVRGTTLPLVVPMTS